MAATVDVAFPSPEESGPSCSEAFRTACKNTKRLIQLRLVYIRYIADVQTLDQTFKACFGLDMLWPATAEDESNFAKDAKKYEPGWVPNFEFPSAKEVTLERRVLVTGNPFKVTPNHLNFCRTLVTGTFMEQFELKNYPFDVQDLTIIMDLSFDLKEEALWIPWQESFPLDPNESPSDKKNFIQLNRAFSAIPDFVAKRVVCEFAVRDNCWGQVKLRIQMERRPEGTLGRVASLCCMLGVATLSTFSLDVDDNHNDRVGFLITYILAFVAFQFIVSSSLPPTAYLTLLDKYTLSSFLYLTTLLCVISILRVCTFDTEDDRRYADRVLFIVAACTVGFINFAFVASGWLARRTELKKFRMDMRDLDNSNKGEHDGPINVYGSHLLKDCVTGHDGDAFLSFEGKETTKKPYFFNIN